MTRKEEIKMLEAESARLNKRLTVLKSLPEPIEEKEIASFDDLRPLTRILLRGGIKTVEDLITSTPKAILTIRDIGEKRFETICRCMKKNGLNFI